MFPRIAVTVVAVRGTRSLVDYASTAVIGRSQLSSANVYPERFEVEMALMEFASADHRRCPILEVPARPTAS